MIKKISCVNQLYIHRQIGGGRRRDQNRLFRIIFVKLHILYGNIRMTKVSKGSGEIHRAMWQTILKKQLQVTQDYFNKMI